MRLSRKKKASPPMEDLINLIDSALAAAGQSCTQCLIDELGNEASELGEAIVALNTAYLMRPVLPDGEDNLTDTLARFLTLVTKMAVFTAELNGRPGIRWTDESTEIAFPVIVIPN
jgi:hypothetical protein